MSSILAYVMVYGSQRGETLEWLLLLVFLLELFLIRIQKLGIERIHVGYCR